MQDITILGANFAVLTYGRSGSNLLAANLGYSLNVYPVFVHNESDLVQDPIGKSVIHSHLLYQSQQLKSYVRVFNLRRNSVNTIISTALTSHYNYYHQFTNKSRPTLSKIVLEIKEIDYLCRGFAQWHNHYSQQLTSKDFVVFYEDMIENLTSPNKVYTQTFPDKKSLIENYDEVENFLLEKYYKLFGQIVLPFCQHVNHCDFVKLIDV